MATVKVYDQNKQESGEVTLASDVFEVEVRPEILHLVVRAQMAAKRAGITTLLLSEENRKTSRRSSPTTSGG